MDNSIIGKIIISIEVSDDSVLFICSDKTKYVMEHYQDCCEHVQIDNIDGDISKLIGKKIIDCYESHPEKNNKNELFGDSFTWTDYGFQTDEILVIFSWLGVSNGYYSETPTFNMISK